MAVDKTIFAVQVVILWKLKYNKDNISFTPVHKGKRTETNPWHKLPQRVLMLAEQSAARLG